MSKTINDIATDIENNEFGCDEYLPKFKSIHGWLSANIGRLNVKLYTCFGEDEEGQEVFAEDVVFDDEAADIYKMMYLHHVYSKKLANALRGVLDGTESAIIKIEEGDTKITKTNKNELAKTLRGYVNDLKMDLDESIGRYHIYVSDPQQVIDP